LYHQFHQVLSDCNTLTWFCNSLMMSSSCVILAERFGGGDLERLRCTHGVPDEYPLWGTAYMLAVAMQEAGL